MHGPRNRAIVLTSGGLDSTTCLAIAREQGFAHLHSLTFDYGQRHRFELTAAAAVAAAFGADHRVIQIDLRQFGRSALTDEIPVPKDRDEAEMAGQIPITYVPARNTIFLSYALGWAEVLGISDIFIGVNAVDYSGYPDCRPQFIAAFEKLANLATQSAVEQRATASSCIPPPLVSRGSDGEGAEALAAPMAPTPALPRSTRGGEGGEVRECSPAVEHDCQPPFFKIRAPLIQLTKAQIILKGVALGVDYSMTHSCYDPTYAGLACGRCDSCIIRRKGFQQAGVADPTRYV